MNKRKRQQTNDKKIHKIMEKNEGFSWNGNKLFKKRNRHQKSYT